MAAELILCVWAAILCVQQQSQWERAEGKRRVKSKQTLQFYWWPQRLPSRCLGPGRGSLKWLVKHRNIDSIILGKHATTAPRCVGWLAAWVRPLAILCPFYPKSRNPMPCSAASCEPSVLRVIESSCSRWAEVRVLQSAPQPWTEHTGIPFPP